MQALLLLKLQLGDALPREGLLRVEPPQVPEEAQH
jgi:hypothetical protein